MGISLQASKWFTRDWTLQEFVAPASIEFFSREGELLGSKEMLAGRIQEITGVPISALHGAPLSSFSVVERMNWAATRNTKRIEDKVYSLQRIFDVFMSPIYGEGRNAVVRLKNKIARSYRSQLDDSGRSFFTSDFCGLDNYDTNPISNTAKETTIHDRRRGFLNSLSFDQMNPSDVPQSKALIPQNANGYWNIPTTEAGLNSRIFISTMDFCGSTENLGLENKR